MRALRFAAAAASLCCLSFPGAASAQSVLPPDGYVSAQEVCEGGLDVFDQKTLYRPYGGVLHVPPGLSADRRAALAEAARMRAVDSNGKAYWRLIDGDEFLLDDGLPRDFSGVVVASCSAGQQGTAERWTWKKPAAGLGIVWDAFAPADWVAQLSVALRQLEGVGVHIPNVSRPSGLGGQQ